MGITLINNNFLALVITFIIALLWLRINDFLAHQGIIDSHLSRKLIHIGTGPFFVLCWLLFNDNDNARFLAALVPLAFTVQFLLIGLGVIKDEASVKGMSRSGDRREILRGPLFYGIIFVITTILYWKHSPIGIIALMLMCGGDGLADLFGKKWGRTKLPWNEGKTWIGSFGMFLGGWLFSVIVMWIYSRVGIFPTPLSSYLIPITIIAFVATIVESLPLDDIDNITITLAAIILGHLLF